MVAVAESVVSSESRSGVPDSAVLGSQKRCALMGGEGGGNARSLEYHQRYYLERTWYRCHYSEPDMCPVMSVLLWEAASSDEVEHNGDKWPPAGLAGLSTEIL